MSPQSPKDLTGAFSRRTAIVGLAAAAITRPAGAQEAYPGLALGRPHTDFVQAQPSPSRVLGDKNSQPGVDAGTVSYDAKNTRAVSGVFHYAAGWRFDRAHYVNSDQEIFVLDGSVTFDDVEYTAGCYAYLPAGLQHKLMESKSGATVLNFYEGEHLAFYEPPPANMYLAQKLVRRLETAAMPWKTGTPDDIKTWGPSARRKVLRHDAATGESTWLLKVAADPATAQRRTMIHSAVEEMFLLEGEIATPQGLMTTGAYAWRVPGVPLGPFGSKTGFTALFRNKGGPLKTIWSAEATPVVWDAPYQPILADGQKAWAFKPYDRSKKY